MLLYLGTLAITHFFRSWRWNYLLRPLGAALPLRRLLPVSSVGFMAILALPIRLGEFVRPYFVTREGRIRMSAAVGTVAVERIVDGLLISILFFVSYLLSSPDVFSPELRFGAWLSLIGFVGLTTFLAVAQVWTEPTIDLVLRFSLLRRFAPARAERLGDRLRSLISGFTVMRDRRNFSIFLVQSILYWGANGFGMWILARQMGLPISVSAAFTTMAFTGVVLTLPNSPGLVGQFHAAIKLGLAAYLPLAVVNAKGMAYAIVLHGIQTLWYVATGLLSLLAISGSGGPARLARRGGARIEPRRQSERRDARRASHRSRSGMSRRGGAGAIAPLAAAALTLISLAAAPAHARSSVVVPYTIAEVWPAAIRFLRVDRNYRVREKDEPAGYVLFDLPENKRTYRAALEMVKTTDDEGRVATQTHLHDHRPAPPLRGDAARPAGRQGQRGARPAAGAPAAGRRRSAAQGQTSPDSKPEPKPDDGDLSQLPKPPTWGPAPR